MPKLLLTLFIMLSYLNAQAILAVKDKTLEIDATNLRVGESGVVIKQLSPELSSIIATVTVDNIEQNRAFLSYKLSNLISQEAMPAGKWTPTTKDSVQMHFMYKRALLVAPNRIEYLKAVRGLKKELIHPDVFGGILALNGHVAPTKEDFQGFCSAYSVGLLYFLVDGKRYELDCQSFKVLDKTPHSLQTKKTDLPFYVKIKGIVPNFFGDGNEPVTDYKTYFLELLEQKK